MNNASLSLSQSPPLSVPLRYFFTAPVFAIACGLVLLWYGADAFSSRWHPALLAATHFLTLGFIAMIMIGALQQLTPVLMGAQIPYPESFSKLIHIPFTAGTLSLTGGWIFQQPVLFTLAGILLGLAISVFILVLLYVLRKARTDHATVNSTKLALIAFFITMALGTILVFGYGGMDINHLPSMTDMHMSWGLLGWVSLLLIGVAYQVVPMFQITPEYPKLMVRWLVILMFIFLICWSGVQIYFSEELLLLNLLTAFLMFGLLFFLLATLYLLANRRRNIPDITLNFWRVAMGNLLIVIIIWILSLFEIHARLEFFIGILMIVGFAMSAINGMLYKIVPFLIWLHLNNYAHGKDRTKFKIPNMKQVLPEAKAMLHFYAHSLMLLLSYLSVFWPEYFLRPASVLLIISSLILLNNIWYALRVYNYHSSKIIA